MPDRRRTYFLFQGLLTAVLMLVFFLQREPGWSVRLAVLAVLSTGSLALILKAPPSLLLKPWFSSALFVGDAALASLILQWIHPHPELYLIYGVILLGTALTRNVAQSLVVALAVAGLYLLSSWSPGRGLPHDAAFWLRFQFLLIMTSFSAILSRDTREVQKEQEKRYQERLVQMGRLATLGQVAAEVAHRIKGPLTTIRVNAEVLAHRSRSSRALKELEQIRREVDHCKDILRNLLDLGRIEEMDFVRLDLREPIAHALEALAPQAARRRILVEKVGFEAPLPLSGDPSLLQEAFVAVLQNALDAARSGGRIRVAVAAAPARWMGGGGRASYEVSVADDGAGIAPENLERIFQPFFTTKGAEGSGLGLSAALRILQKHNGSIEAESAGLGKGARFVLVLPKTPPDGLRFSSTRSA